MNNHLEKGYAQGYPAHYSYHAAVFHRFLDRVNIGFAALTMNQDLGFSPTVFGLGAGILPRLLSV